MIDRVHQERTDGDTFTQLDEEIYGQYIYISYRLAYLDRLGDLIHISNSSCIMSCVSPFLYSVLCDIFLKVQLLRVNKDLFSIPDGIQPIEEKTGIGL